MIYPYLIDLSITGLLTCVAFLAVIGVRECWHTWKEHHE